MKHIFVVIIYITFLLACKHQGPDKPPITSSLPDTNFLDTSSSVQEDLTKPKKTAKEIVFDTILYFQTVERIFEDEFYLVFNNDSNELMKFYFIPSFSRQINYSFISESEGDFTSNPHLEGKKFKISYSHKNQVSFTGEPEITNIIESIILLNRMEVETPERLIHSMKLEAHELQTCIDNIEWQDAVRNDSSVILYEEDFRYSHLKRIHQVFVGINDCSGDSIFQTFYSDRTVHTGGTVSAIYWTIDFSLPSLNLSRGEEKESILAKLGAPSYDFDSLLVYPKYLPDVIVEVEGGKNYDDAVFLVFRNNKLIGIVARFYVIC